MTRVIFSYEKMRGRILCRMVGTEKCRELSDDVVRIPYLDVSVIFCIFPDEAEAGRRAGFRVTQELLQFWGVSAEEMMREAFRNTRSRYRYIFRNLFRVTDAIARDAAGFMRDPLRTVESVPGGGGVVRGEETEEGKTGGSTVKDGVYTLINQDFFNGAVILLFPDLLEEFALEAGGDLVILPSSVNELICLPRREDTDYGCLRSIVRAVNDTCVSAGEKLSDSIYVYLQEEKRVEIIPEKQEEDEEDGQGTPVKRGVVI